MIENDRDRLLVGVGFALALHVILAVVLAIVGLNTPPYPENEPVFVTLPEYEPPAEEPEPEPEEISAPPEPAEPELETAEQELESAEQELETRPEPSPEIRTDPVPSTPAPAETAAAPPAGTDAPPGSLSTDDLPWLQDSGDSERGATRAPDPFADPDREPDDVDRDLPSWVIEGEVQPMGRLDEGEQQALEEKSESDPRFAELLSELTRALENPPSSTAGSETGTSTGGEEGPASATTALPGGSVIDWVGSGGRRPIGQLAPPRLTASDFGGTVPARISYLIVFEVNAEGLVVPGSLIVRQGSGYTLADQKVRASISTWRFEAAPGAPPVTAIATLRITRDEIR